MISTYLAPYGLKDFSAALRALARPFPDVGHDWFPVYRGHGVEVFPTHRGREGQYALLRALDLPVGARVGVPLFTHPVVWEAIVTAGMQPVFIDSDPVTFGLSLSDLQEKRDRLDCLVLIHTFGYPADFDAVARIVSDKPILEDCAHSLGSTYHQRPVGCCGIGAFFTFLFSKPLGVGGGGCAVTKHQVLGKKVQALLRDGQQETFLQGLSHATATLVFALIHKKLCYSHLTHLAHTQIFKRSARKLGHPVSSLLHMRRSDWAVLASRLETWAADLGTNANFWREVRMSLPQAWLVPPEPEWGTWNHWLLPVRAPNAEAGALGVAKLRSHGVGASLVYDGFPEVARSFGYSGDCPEAERLARSVFVLPSHCALTHSERQQILNGIQLLAECDPDRSSHSRTAYVSDAPPRTVAR
jgi:perosamine synthetase